MSRKLFDLSGKRALVTGSSQGIGLAIAEGLAGAGAEIILNGRDRAKLENTVAALRQKGFKVQGFDFDVYRFCDVHPRIGLVRSVDV